MSDLACLQLFLMDDRSWYDVSTQQLSYPQSTVKSTGHWIERLSAFLQIGQTDLQSQRTPAFPTPNDESKKRFESLTAPVNVPPSTSKHYDISQIKNDVTWLSKELDLNEEQALRVVLLEWQDRPKLKLRAGYSDAEIASLKNVYASQLAFDADFEAATFQLRNDEEFAKESSRRQRQVFIHFKECIGFARTWLALRNQSLEEELKVLIQKPPALDPIVELAVKQVQLFAQGLGGEDFHEQTAYILQTGRLYYISEILQSVFLAADNTQLVSPDIVKKWFECMADTLFLRNIEPSPLMPQQEVQRLEYLISLTSIALLQPARTIDHLETSWVTDMTVVSELQQILLNATDEGCTPAIPVAFTWSLILQDVRERGIAAKERRDSPNATRSLDSTSWDSATGRRSSIAGSTQQSIFEDIIDAVLAVSGLPDPISTVIQTTIENFNVANLITTMLKISKGLPFVQRLKSLTVQEIIVVALNTLPDAYGPIVLEPQFAVLEPDYVDVEACNNFLEQPDLLEGIFDNAAARFPHESYPLFRLCRLLACAFGDGKFNGNGDQYITFRLDSMKTFTHLAVGQFEHYHTVHEDENANLVELNQHTYAFPREVGLLTQGKGQSSALVIPANTEGEVISSSSPPVVKWKFEYSGLHLIGEWLELYYNGVLHEVIPMYEDPTSIASEMILLLTNLLATTSASESGSQDAVFSILEKVSSNLSFESNIVGLVFDILEQDIQAYKRKPTNDADSSVLHASLNFARAILMIQPSQFWRYIAKTSVASGNGLLSAIVLGVETTSNETSATLAVADLYSAMVTASLQRPLGLARSTLYKNDEKLYETIMLNLTQSMLEMYDSISQWRYVGKQKQTLVTKLNDSFASILYLAFGIGSEFSRSTICLKSAGRLLLDHLRPETVHDARSGPILNHMLDSVQLRESFVTSTTSGVCFCSLLGIAKILVETASNQRLPTSGLEHCLLDLAPVFVRNLDVNYPSETRLGVSVLYPASQLLCGLISSLSPTNPTSLLGYLGSVSAIDTISILATSPPDNTFALEAWRLLSELINRDQQWLSIVILTGSLPEQKGREKSATDDNGDGIVYRGRLLVSKGLDLLSRVEDVEKHLAQAVLQFMITAQQNWSWTLNVLRSRAEIFTVLIKFVTNRANLPSQLHGLHNFIATLITDFCSVYLQYAKSTRDKRVADTVTPLIEWLALNAISVKSYNASLHTNLSRNFENKFSIALSDFRRHARSSTDTDYYDINVIDTILSSNASWNTPSVHGQRHQSYRSEVERANTNLFMVDSELTLLKSFQSLLLEHASYFAELDSLKNVLAPIVRRCIDANSETNTKTAIHLQLFDNILQSRAETVLSLLQQMLRVKMTGSEVRELFKPAWESCLLENASYEKAMVNDDLTYWRTSLNAVLLALQFHLGKSKSAWKPLVSVSGPNQESAAAELLKHTTNIQAQIVEVGRVIIGQGLDTVVSIILEAKQAELQKPPSIRIDVEDSTKNVGLTDLRLILNFLTSVLRHPRLPEFRAQLAQVLINTGAIQTALRLYSFSHLLAGPDTGNDPIHGEIALRLLVSLSSLSECSEELAIEGVLSQLLTARVTTALQRMPEGVGNLDARQHCASLYAIWSQGILPLILNLLNAVGAPIASEVSTFINTFPNQLRKLSSAFQPRGEQGTGFLTLALAKEVSTMSLLSFILDDYRRAGASAAVDPSLIQTLQGFDDYKTSLISDLKEHLTLDKGVLARKIVPTTASEEAMGGKLVDQVLGEFRDAIACLTNGEEEI